MENKCFIEDFHIELNRETVFKMMDCYEESPVYDEVCDAFTQWAPWLYKHVRPRAVLAWEPWSAKLEQELSMSDSGDGAFAGLMYLLMTLGPEAEAESGRCFARGDYLEGMLLDAMADDYLFQMEDKVSEEMRLLCGRIGLGIQKRMEAPQDLPMAFHRRVLDICGVASEWDMSLSSGFMFAPVKTSCVVFGLTKDTQVFRAQHDCSHCPAVHCRLRIKN